MKIGSIVGVALAAAFGLASCGGRSSVVDAAEENRGRDGKQQPGDGARDGRRDTRGDQRRDAPRDFAARDKRGPDKFVWPDLKKKDVWPWPADGYTGTPFGCQLDDDCFGQKCCPTPWGMKLCSPVCDHE